MDALRKRYCDYLWDAEFRDTLGAEILVLDGPSTIRHAVFVSHVHGKRAVVIVNQGYDDPVRIQLSMQRASPKLVVASPDNPAALPFDDRLVIEPVSAVVIMEQ